MAEHLLSHRRKFLLLASVAAAVVLFRRRGRMRSNSLVRHESGGSIAMGASSSSIASACSDPVSPVTTSSPFSFHTTSHPHHIGTSKALFRTGVPFLRRLFAILRIIFPHLASKETICLTALSLMLMLRTYLSVVIARISGRNGQNLVSRRLEPFFEGVFLFLLVTLPTAFINSSLKFLTSLLALRIRIRLTEHVHDAYLHGVNFYKAANLSGDYQLDNPDQRVTSDIAHFSQSLAQLFTESFKPLLDVVLFTKQLSDSLGWQGPALMYAYFAITALIKKKVMPSFGKMASEQSSLEGLYRRAHTRLIANAEEVAFYKGGCKERNLIEQALQNICDHLKSWKRKQVVVGIVDGLLVKYWATITGYCAVMSPFVLDLPHVRGKKSEEITRDYILNIQFLMSLNQAVGQLVLLGNKVNVIAGYTRRVSELLEMTEELNHQGNRAFIVMRSEGEDCTPRAGLHQWLLGWKERCDRTREQRLQRYNRASAPVQGGGTVIESEDYISFEDCDLVAPDGQMLARKLNFKVEHGMNVMITGPNGCGKSSMFRVIGELWPLHNGVLYRPQAGNILFVPQKPYLVQGTLRDQIIYPHSQEEMATLGVTDDDLEHLLAAVDPHATILNLWRWSDIRDWSTALSGGQKQRVAMARLFYHRPMFAILDECTSSVSDEVEDAIYETCKVLGIALFTVSHRPSLQRHHDYILEFDGRGAWEMYPIVN
eukprot:GGOE01019124.1.p1 GENE.GGOE01019124.1~~GGOE01019124.1.p1  ORF type:complete len:713 (+),score=229.44 GGOE01019124.1:53-2191(+)